MKKQNKIIERCGACGDYLNITMEELKKLTPKYLDKHIIYVHCGCENQENQHIVTREMAMDAQDLSLEGQRI